MTNHQQLCIEDGGFELTSNKNNKVATVELSTHFDKPASAFRQNQYTLSSQSKIKTIRNCS